MDNTLLARYLDTLHRVVQSISSRASFRSTLQEILTALAEHLDFERPHILVQDPESLNLRLSIVYGQADAHVAYAPGKGITGQVFSSGQGIIVPHMLEHPDFRNRLFERTEKEMASLAFICVPIRVDSESEVLGTLSADTPTAPDASLRLRYSFLESVASLIGKRVSYLQEELARQHFRSLSEDDPNLPAVPSIIGSSKCIRQVIRQAIQVGPSRATALLRGESGTGKELLAEAIHRSSPRRNRPFVTLNCAALPSELLEGELFGWRKGAFTGAVQNRKGLFEQADGGTLFLDEIGDLSLPAQAKVLRAIQDKQIQCLGSEHLISVDARLVCATNRPLEQLVQQGLFREDLYYRINVFPIFIPPLRDRREDIPQIAEHFLSIFCKEYDRNVQCISTPALDLLLQYSWPGNVRELRNIMERAVLVCDETSIRTYHLPQALQKEDTLYEPIRLSPMGFTETVNQLEQKMIVEALEKTQGNIHEAARLLKLTYRILQYKVKKYGIDYRTFNKLDIVE